MLADVEKPDRTYIVLDMGPPECGEDFCDGCGDCLHCQQWECRDGNGCRWVVYLNDEKNPFRDQDGEG